MPVMTNEGAEDLEVAATGAATIVDAPESADKAEEVSESEQSASADDAPEETAEEPKADKPKRPRPSLRAVAVALVFAGLLGVTGFLGWQWWQQHQLSQARDAAQRAAVSYAQVLTSIDSAKVDENFKEVLDGSTGEFKDMYSKSSVELRQLLIENKATAHGVVVDSAVQEASKDKAVVLLFVDQRVSNEKLPDPRIDRSRMKMTLEKIDGRWRASKVELP